MAFSPLATLDNVQEAVKAELGVDPDADLQLHHNLGELKGQGSLHDIGVSDGDEVVLTAAEGVLPAKDPNAEKPWWDPMGIF
mmetsp:Transcript_12326/g.30802  ORF Transcript_12326/g.30802 Transcript_12326/m.30802 type:complete len:82 (-) Transcript_12326:168-413(-)